MDINTILVEIEETNEKRHKLYQTFISSLETKILLKEITCFYDLISETYVNAEHVLNILKVCFGLPSEYEETDIRFNGFGKTNKGYIVEYDDFNSLNEITFQIVIPQNL